MGIWEKACVLRLTNIALFSDPPVMLLRTRLSTDLLSAGLIGIAQERERGSGGGRVFCLLASLRFSCCLERLHSFKGAKTLNLAPVLFITLNLFKLHFCFSYSRTLYNRVASFVKIRLGYHHHHHHIDHSVIQILYCVPFFLPFSPSFPIKILIYCFILLSGLYSIPFPLHEQDDFT